MSTSTVVAIIGAGAMGHGIALQCAVTDHDVTLLDHRQRNLDRARDRMRNAATFLRDRDLTDRQPSEVLDRVAFTLESGDGLDTADVVVESISEDLAAKRDLFATVADEAPRDAVLATNTSSLPVSAIAEGASGHAERIAGCHWWYPPYLLRPVEVVEGEGTSSETIEGLRAFVEGVDRDPVHVKRDVPGFVWNRVQFAVVRECLHVVAEGIASVEDVNRAIRDGYAARTAAVGPFETMDIAGLDLFATIADDLYPDLATDDEVQEPLAELVRQGATGIDAGAGFFEYDDSAEDVTRRRDERVAAVRRALEEGLE